MTAYDRWKTAEPDYADEPEPDDPEAESLWESVPPLRPEDQCPYCGGYNDHSAFMCAAMGEFTL